VKYKQECDIKEQKKQIASLRAKVDQGEKILQEKEHQIKTMKEALKRADDNLKEA